MMTKSLFCFPLFLMFVFCIGCKQNPDEESKDTAKSELQDTISPYGPDSMVRNVKQAKNGDLLIASYNGVLRYDGKSFTNITSKISAPSFWDVLEDRKGILWFASKDSGIYRYDGKSVQNFTTRNGLGSNRVMKIYEDNAGNLWLGTGGGICRYDGKSFRNFTTKDGLPNNDITTIVEDNSGKLWIGTRGNACFFDGIKFTVFKNKDGKAFHNVWSIIEDKKGTIWFGAEIIEDKKGDTLILSAGLWRYDGQSYTKVSNRGAYAITEDSKGNLWTTGAVNPPNSNVWALSRYDQKSLYNKEPAVTQILTTEGTGMLCGILEADDGSIWFGSLNGVYRYDGKTTTNFKSAKNQKQ